MFSIVPIRTPVKSYSSITGTGTEFSTKTLGRIVIFLGSDRCLLQLENNIVRINNCIQKIKDKFFMVDFKSISLNE